MQLGELFFSLGFKSSGMGEAGKFESAMESAAEFTEALRESLGRLEEIMGKIAVKMGALTKEELKGIQTARTAQAIDKADLPIQRQQGQQMNLKAGLLSVLNQRMRNYWGSMNAARVQALAFTGGITAFVKKASDAAVGLDKIAMATGLSSQALQRMGDMAAQAGSSVEDVGATVQHLQAEATNIALGKGGNIGVWAYLGLDPKDDPFVTLDKLSNKLKTMPAALGVNMARDLGLSSEMIYFLQNKQNLEPVSDELILTDKEVKRLKDFNLYFNRTWEASKRTMQKFAAAIAPAVSGVIYFFERLNMMVGWASSKMDPFFKSIKAFMPMIVTLGAILFAAFFPVTATLIAMALAFEDIWTWSQGGKSVFGGMLNWITDVQKGLTTLIQMFYFFWARTMSPTGKYDEWAAEQANSVANWAQNVLSKKNEAVGVPAGNGIMAPAGGTQNNYFNFDLATGNIDLKSQADHVAKLVSGAVNPAFFEQAPGYNKAR